MEDSALILRWRISSLACSSFLALGAWLAPLDATAQAQIRPADRPGGTIERFRAPDPIQDDKPVLPQTPGLKKIPLFIDRPDVDPDELVVVRAFRLVGAKDHPEFGLFTSDLDVILNKALEERPAGFTLEELSAVAGLVAEQYRAKGFMVARAFVPAQDVKEDTVEIHVLEGVLGNVTFSRGKEGRYRYDDDTLAAIIDPVVGKAVNRDSIEEVMLLLTDLPGIDARGLFRPGKKVGETEFLVNLGSEKPVSGTLSLDNHGSENTGIYRAAGSVTINNPLKLGDAFELQVRRTFDPTAGYLAGASYRVPVYKGKTYLGASYLRDQFDVRGPATEDPTAPRFDGDSRIASAYLEHTFVRKLKTNVTGRVTVANKRSFTNQDDAGRILADNVSVVELLGTVFATDRALSEKETNINALSLQLTRGLPGFLGAADDEKTTTPEAPPPSRQGASGFFADGSFTKVSVGATRLQHLPSEAHDVLFRFEGQFSNDILVPVEQFSIGGPNSVRAYDLADVLTDSGVFASIALRSSFPAVPKALTEAGLPFESVQFRTSLFADYAIGWTNDTDPANQRQKIEYKGVGVGMEFSDPGLWTFKVDAATRVGNRARVRDGVSGTDGLSTSRPSQVWASFAMDF